MRGRQFGHDHSDGNGAIGRQNDRVGGKYQLNAMIRTLHGLRDLRRETRR